MFDSETTIQSVFIPIINDMEQDGGTENFTVQLTLLDETLCNTTTVFILDDQAAPTTTTPGMLMINISPFLHDVLSQLSVLFAYSSQSDDTVAAEQVQYK